MQNTNNSELLERFEQHLDEMAEKLKSCQDEKNLKSCSDCGSFLECKLRDDYIKSVYNSMSKGETGGFEF